MTKFENALNQCQPPPRS